MALAEDLRTLAQASLAALVASHDYHTFSKRVWKQLDVAVIGGRTFRVRNRTTGTSLNAAGLMARAKEYQENYLTASTFQHFVALFEDFLFDLMRCWLLAHPGSLSNKTVELGALLRTGSVEAVVANVVERELNEVKYERLADCGSRISESS